MKKNILLLSLLTLSLASCNSSNSLPPIIDPDIEEPTPVTPKEVKVEAVYFLDDSITLAYLGEAQLRYKILPSNATNQKVKIEIIDESVATLLDNNVIRANKIGKTVAKITTEDGNKIAYCPILCNSGVVLDEKNSTELKSAIDLIKTKSNYHALQESTIIGSTFKLDRYFDGQYYYETHLDDDSNSYGYALDNNNKVFKYYKNSDKTITPYEFCTNNKGDYSNTIYNQIPTFKDVPNIETYQKNMKIGEHQYMITDLEIKKSFAIASRFIEKIAPYISCIYLTINYENNSISSIDYTLDCYEQLLGYLYGTIDNFDNVSLTEIKDYVNNGGSAQEVPSELSKAKELLLNNNFHGVRVTNKHDSEGNIVKDGDGNAIIITKTNEYYTNEYYLSIPTSEGLEEDNTLKTEGYINLRNKGEYNGVYKFTLDDKDQVVINEKVADFSEYEGGVIDFLRYPNTLKALNYIDTMIYSEPNDAYITRDASFTEQFANYFGFGLEEASYGGAFKITKDEANNITKINIWYLFNYLGLIYLDHTLDNFGTTSYASVEAYLAK